MTGSRALALPGDELVAQPMSQATRATDIVDLYWLPLGAGGHCVRFNGLVYERLAAWLARRAPRALYHSALEVRVDGRRFVIEMAPVWNNPAPERGVVGEGAVGDRRLGRWRAFRYEIRRWPGGEIPDIAEAVDSPRTLSADAAVARLVLDLVPRVPRPVWGRDELRTGDMWNSNSVIAWLLASSGIALDGVAPPAGGRAPGWDAGIAVAAQARCSSSQVSVRDQASRALAS